jgi:hypothetical protein
MKPVFDYRERRRRLDNRLRERGVDLLFLPPSSDLEYLTSAERTIPTFGQSTPSAARSGLIPPFPASRTHTGDNAVGAPWDGFLRGRLAVR